MVSLQSPLDFLFSHLRPLVLCVLRAVLGLNQPPCGKLQGSAGVPLFDIACSLILLSSSNFESHRVSVPHPPELSESQRALSFLDAHIAISRFNHPKRLLDLLHPDPSHSVSTPLSQQGLTTQAVVQKLLAFFLSILFTSVFLSLLMMEKTSQSHTLVVWRLVIFSLVLSPVCFFLYHTQKIHLFFCFSVFLTLLHVLILLSLDYFNICFRTSLKVSPLSLVTKKRACWDLPFSSASENSLSFCLCDSSWCPLVSKFLVFAFMTLQNPASVSNWTLTFPAFL